MQIMSGWNCNSNKPKHRCLSNLCFGNNCRRFLTKDTTVSVNKTPPSSSRNHISFDPTVKEQISASKALWVFSFRAYTGISFFKNCFLIQIWQNHLLWVDKKHHVLQDGLASLLSHWLATKLKKLKGTFMIMFDGTTTCQSRK